VSPPAGVDVDEVARLLSDSYGVMCRSGKLCAQPFVDGSGDGRPVLRISGYVYTSAEDIHTAFKALDEVLTVVGTSKAAAFATEYRQEYPTAASRLIAGAEAMG
jgi:hypothetical protein